MVPAFLEVTAALQRSRLELSICTELRGSPVIARRDLELFLVDLGLGGSYAVWLDESISSFVSQRGLSEPTLLHHFTVASLLQVEWETNLGPALLEAAAALRRSRLRLSNCAEDKGSPIVTRRELQLVSVDLGLRGSHAVRSDESTSSFLDQRDIWKLVWLSGLTFDGGTNFGPAILEGPAALQRSFLRLSICGEERGSPTTARRDLEKPVLVVLGLGGSHLLDESMSSFLDQRGISKPVLLPDLTVTSLLQADESTKPAAILTSAANL